MSALAAALGAILDPILDPVSSSSHAALDPAPTSDISQPVDISQPAEQPRSGNLASHAAHTPHTAALRERAIAPPPCASAPSRSSAKVSAPLPSPPRLASPSAPSAPATAARERLALAVERQLAIAAAAWASYHHAFMLEQLAYDHYQMCVEWYRDHPGDAMPPAPPRPSTACARFLSVALAAQREAARLQGCYDRPRSAPVTTIVNYPPSAVRAPSPPSPDLQPQSPFPATPATTPSPASLSTWSSALSQPPAPRSAKTATAATAPCPPPATPRSTSNPAKTATATSQPVTAAPIIAPIPAKTATASPTSPASSLRPANPTTTAFPSLNPATPATPATAPRASARLTPSSTTRTVHRPRHYWQHFM